MPVWTKPVVTGCNMKKDIPLTIEIIPCRDDDKYCITSPKEIEAVLRGIAKDASRIALYYSNTDEFILTTLLGFDKTGLWLEQGPNGTDNRRIIASSRLFIVGAHLQVKIQFSVNRAEGAMYRGFPAFFLPFPDRIYRMQRREYFRISATAVNPLQCVISREKISGKRHEFMILDISCGGVGLTCTAADTELVAGASYPDCRIDLPEVGVISGTIEVKTLVSFTSASGKINKRAGCEFKRLDGASTILLQRYVTNMQRADKS